MSVILFLGGNFNMCIVNIRRVYATNKNKVSIIIWPPTVVNLRNNFLIFSHKVLNILIRVSGTFKTCNRNNSTFRVTENFVTVS